MKKPAFVLLACLLLAGLINPNFQLHPSDIQAALAWNAAVVLAPLVAMIFQWKMAKELKIPALIFFCTIAVINTAIMLGSRLGAWGGMDWYNAIAGHGLPVLPGKTILGGIVLSLLAFIALRRWWQLPLQMADVLVIGLPLGGAVARVGCLFAGCCYGNLSAGDYGVSYGPGTPAYMHQVDQGLISHEAASSLAVYPIQLYQLIGCLLIFGLLWRYRKTFRQPGALVFLGLSLLAFQRFGIEFFRDVATNRGAFGISWYGLKVAQWFCLFLAAGSFLAFRYFRSASSKLVLPKPSRVALKQQSLLMAGLSLSVLALGNILTLDESLFILLSCLPALVLLALALMKARQHGQQVLAPALMLSASVLCLFSMPIDSIGLDTIKPSVRQWIEVGGGGAFGSYRDVSRDCGGEIISDEKVKYQTGGLDISSNWQVGETYYAGGIRGAIGMADHENNNSKTHNYRYSAYGLYGKISYRWIGFSLGVFSRTLTFEDGSRKPVFRQAGTLRIGHASRYSVDLRVFDEPGFGFSMEPFVSFSPFTWGFKDPSGNTYVRAAFAWSRDNESALNLSGRFPLDGGFVGELSGYFGGVNMVQFGLRYQIPVNSRK